MISVSRRTSRSGSARTGTCTCTPARAGSRRCPRSRRRRTAPRTSPSAPAKAPAVAGQPRIGVKKPTKVKPVHSANDDPQDVLGALAQQLVRAPRRRVELHARAAVALGPALHPQEDLGPHRLRTGVAAPQAAGDRGEEEQRQRGDDQQPGEEDEILRPEHQAEDVELARRQVEQHRLAAVPVAATGTRRRCRAAPHRQQCAGARNARRLRADRSCPRRRTATVAAADVNGMPHSQRSPRCRR